MSAGTKADSEGTLVRPNQVNDQVNKIAYYRSNTRIQEYNKFLNALRRTQRFLLILKKGILF